jgi:hypothetical protein
VVGPGSSKQAKKIMKEAADGKKLARHDGHKLKDGKTGKDHWQKKAGDGAHAFYSTKDIVKSSVMMISGGSALQDLSTVGKDVLGDNVVGNFILDFKDAAELYDFILDILIESQMEAQQAESENADNGSSEQENETTSDENTESDTEENDEEE